MNAHCQSFMLTCICIGAFIGAVAPLPPAQADVYFACRPDHNGQPVQLQIKNNAVRCYAPAGYSYVGLKNCLPGQVFRIDYVGNADKCVTGVGTAAIVVDPPCADTLNFSLEPRKGNDRCRRPVPQYIRAPDVQVNR